MVSQSTDEEAYPTSSPDGNYLLIGTTLLSLPEIRVVPVYLAMMYGAWQSYLPMGSNIM
ncbi:hypothetical protein [Niabella ginsenosidivorans]|uniref:hypothetical protein n=1 Tax=Niabella ginsenosidivorans TaxID=1176587 RepID=UPI0014714107|nr:hypothetical protein [Niabella ginsenosidivorans]